MTDDDDKVPGAGYLTFKELFRDARSFKVPDYQRAYDWEPEQRSDLLRDLDKLDRLTQASEHPVSHFCGTVICTPPERPGGPFAVVDGQQRLTTLCLLHARLARAADVRSFLYKPGSTQFTPQGMDANTFDCLLRGDQPHQTQTVAQANYVRAAEEIDRWIAMDADRAGRMLNLVEGHLHFIFFVLRNETEVAKVFETINNRGKPLSQMDLVKNHLIYVAAVNGWHSPKVNEVWKNIQQIVGETRFLDGDVDTVLRAAITAQFKPGRRKTGETDFKIVAEELPAQGCAHERFALFLSFLEGSFRTHRDLRNARSTDPKDPVTRALTHLNHHHGITGVLPLIFARQFRRRDKGKDVKKAPVLEATEIANFRLYGLPDQAKRSDSYNVELHKLAYAYFHKFHERQSDDTLIADLRNLVTRDQKNGLPAIVRSLTLNDDETFDYYGWGWLRYFLARFEESLRDSQSFDFGQLRKAYGGSGHTNDYLSIEHIWPQKDENTTVGAHNDGQQIRRLGNLMLLPRKLNIQLSNLDVETKETQSEQANVMRLRQNEEAGKNGKLAKAFAELLRARGDDRFGAKKSRFNAPLIAENHDLVFLRTLCDLREEAMIAFALRAWHFPGESASEYVFEGMFSLAHSDEAYLASREGPAVKANENYVISAGANEEPPALGRLKARRDVTGDTFKPIVWPPT